MSKKSQKIESAKARAAKTAKPTTVYHRGERFVYGAEIIGEGDETRVVVQLEEYDCTKKVFAEQAKREKEFRALMDRRKKTDF